jgi:hypothetical protein
MKVSRVLVVVVVAHFPVFVASEHASEAIADLAGAWRTMQQFSAAANRPEDAAPYALSTEASVCASNLRRESGCAGCWQQTSWKGTRRGARGDSMQTRGVTIV